MKTLPLRELVRRPTAVKKLTAAGQSVQITDNGKPLWVISAADHAPSKEADSARRQLWDGHFAELMSEPPPRRKAPSLTEALEFSRGRHR